MIKSMTGFGRGIFESDGRNYKVEIKTVNHKYTDINIKIPRHLTFLEDNIRKEVAKNIGRGKVDVFIGMENYSSRGRIVKVDSELANMYIDEIRDTSEAIGIKNDLTASNLIRLPDVISITTTEDEDLIWNELKQALIAAIDNLTIAREIEGERLKQDVLQRKIKLDGALDEIKNKSKTVVSDYMQKLEQRIKDILKTNDIDQVRLAQEVVIFADKCSIEEETTRLDSHLCELINILEKKERCGKNLDFLIQEINREINTIGSKANNLEITNQVVLMKTLTEDIREQIQNIE